jgi:hypothetical protein
MSFFSWLRNRTLTDTPRRRTKPRPAAPRFRPQLEALDERLLPSTLTVTSTLGYAAYGNGSLSTEIGGAQKGDTIVFDQKLFANGPQTIQLSNPPGYFGGAIELFIAKDLTIQGPGAGELAISGGGAARVFDIAQGAHVAISGLTIEGGNARTGAFDPVSTDGYGGGILNEGTLTLSGCTVTHNTATEYGGGYGGGITNFGTMTMSGCTVTGDTAGYGGGGVYNKGTLTVVDSTVTQNVAGNSKYDDFLNAGTFSASSSTIGNKSYK